MASRTVRSSSVFSPLDLEVDLFPAATAEVPHHPGELGEDALFTGRSLACMIPSCSPEDVL